MRKIWFEFATPRSGFQVQPTSPFFSSLKSMTCNSFIYTFYWCYNWTQIYFKISLIQETFPTYLTVQMALIQPYSYRPRHQIWLFLLQTSHLAPKRGSRWFLTSSTTHCQMSVFTAFLAHFPIFWLFSLIKSSFWTLS